MLDIFDNDDDAIGIDEAGPSAVALGPGEGVVAIPAAAAAVAPKAGGKCKSTEFGRGRHGTQTERALLRKHLNLAKTENISVDHSCKTARALVDFASVVGLHRKSSSGRT